MTMKHTFEPLSGHILGAAVEVHRVLGPGYHEAVYEAALCVELELRGIPHARQHEIVLHDVPRREVAILVSLVSLGPACFARDRRPFGLAVLSDPVGRLRVL
jgi:hypothetical protein